MDKNKENNIDELHSRVLQACGSNNIKEIERILAFDGYPVLTQAEKEVHVLKTIIVSLKYSGMGYDVLKYLILDYGIEEPNSFNQFTTKEADELFAKRKLNNELSKELGISSNTSKKPKV